MVLVTPPDTLNRVHDLLAKVWVDSPQISTIDRASFETALIEVAANVIQHANNGNAVECTVAIDASDGVITATLIDTGRESDIELAGARMPDATAESGRGLAIVKALVDEVVYDSDGNVNYWRITRNLTP